MRRVTWGGMTPAQERGEFVAAMVGQFIFGIWCVAVLTAPVWIPASLLLNVYFLVWG